MRSKYSNAVCDSGHCPDDAAVCSASITRTGTLPLPEYFSPYARSPIPDIATERTFRDESLKASSNKLVSNSRSPWYLSQKAINCNEVVAAHRATGESPSSFENRYSGNRVSL